MNNNLVRVWEELVVIPTYSVGSPNKNPMFFENRVYQGSSGTVYPHPIIEKINDEKQDITYQALFLENKYIRMMVLPELGGRIQMAYDKIKNRHFIYYNQVIKPALVGLTGPWISGGIEFNWPQHHRPSTFEPVDYSMEEHADGSKTIWVNEIEQMFHTKGMAGFTLYPDKAYIEISAKLLNRSELPQTFLWWANPAVKVNDHYQSVFPPDVNAVFDHGKRDVSSFPIATGTYYKVDYSPGTDISMYRNIPVPTSYMAINSSYDFVGGYEHDSKAGMLHVSNHHVSPGKKQWTWGNGDFGMAWDRNLTDEDGPYIELMTGMFTDNQPDFTWLMPNEEKSFKQYFLPYRELGILKNASKDILLAIDNLNDSLELKVQVTSDQKDLKIAVLHNSVQIFKDKFDLAVEDVFTKKIKITFPFDLEGLVAVINGGDGRELLRYEPGEDLKNNLPQAAKAAKLPPEISSVEELFLTGQHLEQYRHATYSPVPYYLEALGRAPGDIRSNNALGAWYLRRGQFAKSEAYFKQAIATMIERNPNPYDSEPYYNLGLSLKFQGRDKEAYNAFYKSSWSKAWNDSAFFALARIDIKNTDYFQALAHLNLAQDNNAANSKIYILKSAVLRKQSNFDGAHAVCIAARKRDRFNLGAIFEQMCISLKQNDNMAYAGYRDELLKLSRGDVQNFIEYAIDYLWAGLFTDAIELLSLAIDGKADKPMVCYLIGYLYQQTGQQEMAKQWVKRAASADPYLCFPNRLEDILVLRAAMKLNPDDAMAPYYLGNLFYDKRQYQEAINLWEQSISLNDKFPTVYRNLGIAYFNKRKDPAAAMKCLEYAYSLDNTDDRLFMECYQLYKRMKCDTEDLLSLLEQNQLHVLERDDLYIEKITLLNLQGKFDEAAQMLLARKFHPWEGGEGKVSAQYVLNHVEQAKSAIEQGKFTQAISFLENAQHYPDNLGEGKLFGAQENDIFYWLGCAHECAGNPQAARACLEKASKGSSEPAAAMFYNDQQPDKIFYQGLAWQKLGEHKRANEIFDNLIAYGKDHHQDEVKMDYFAVSLPDLLIFDDNLKSRHQIHCRFISGLGFLGLGELDSARQAFEEVLTNDPTHIGAQIHLKLSHENINSVK